MPDEPLLSAACRDARAGARRRGRGKAVTSPSGPTSPWRVILAIWLAVAGINVLLAEVGPHATYEPLVMLTSSVCGLCVALLLSSITGKLMRHRTRPHWPVLAVLAVTGGTVVWIADGALQFWASHPASLPTAAAYLGIRYNLVYFTLIFAVQTAAVALLSANGELSRRERQLAEAMLAEQQARLAVLQLQLNPHFLFNALNALATLTAQARNEEAGVMIGRLSDFLRTTLVSTVGEYAMLDDEIDAVQTYLDIEAIRFGHRLEVVYECATGLGMARVPCFILQPLVENAIKHAVAPSSGPVVVEIGARREGSDIVLWVRDSGATGKRGEKLPGMGIGMSNIAGRLKTLYGPEGHLDAIQLDDGYLASIRLPFDSEARRS